MNFIFDVLILKSDFDKINIRERFGEWGNEKFSYVPPKYIYQSKLEFHENSDSYFVFLFRDEESIDEVYHVRDSEKLVEIFCGSLSRKSPKGVICLKDNGFINIGQV